MWIHGVCGACGSGWEVAFLDKRKWEKGYNPRDRYTHAHTRAHTPHVFWFSGCHGQKNLPKAVMETQISRGQGRGWIWGWGLPCESPISSQPCESSSQAVPWSTSASSRISAYFQSSAGPRLHPDHLLGCDPNNSLFILLINWTWQCSWIGWALERKGFF